MPNNGKENSLFFTTYTHTHAYALRSHLLNNKTAEDIFDKDIHYHLLQDINEEHHIPNQ